MLSRRALLRGTGAAAIGLPWLEASSPPSVAAAAPPVKRFVVMFTPNGTLAEQWIPSGNESEFSLSPILSPLEPHQQDLVVVSGFSLFFLLAPSTVFDFWVDDMSFY